MGYNREYNGEFQYVPQQGIVYYTKHVLYTTWRMMNIRCYDDRHKAYHRYGGRGVTVCEQWRWDNSFGLFNFINDVGERPDGTTLDRTDNNSNYNPSNVRWVDKRTQQNNMGVGLNNKTGNIGVRFENNKYLVTITLNGVGVTVGTFNSNDFENACELQRKVKSYKIEHTDDETLEFIKSIIDYSPTSKRLRINKTSNYYGVSWDSSRGKWRAMSSYRKTKDGKLINKMVGRFDSEEDAYEAVLKFLDWVKENGYYKKTGKGE